MLKMLHCADIHLDSPFAMEDVKKAEVRRNEVRGTFTSMMLYINMNAIPLVLIAGDLFDRDFVTKDTISLLKREFKNNPTCKFVISPGNHDPYTPTSVYHKTDFPENVYLFENQRLSYFSFDDSNVDVYGYAFVEDSMENNPFRGQKPLHPNRINILCAHGDMAPTKPGKKPKCPITQEDIALSGFDYVALGHNHTSNGIEKIGTTYYGYSGCLEGHDFGETGYKGALYAELEKEKGNFTCMSKGIRFSKRRCERETIDSSGALSMDAVCNAIRKRISEKKYGEDTLLRVLLEGNVAPSLKISIPAIKEQFPQLFSLEVQNATLPLYACETLANDPTIKGTFFSCMLPFLQSESAEERELAAKALQYGLTALNSQEI